MNAAPICNGCGHIANAHSDAGCDGIDPTTGAPCKCPKNAVHASLPAPEIEE